MPPSFRYSRWDGTQHVDDLDAEEVLEALSDDFLSYGDLRAAMQRLYRWGDQNMPGLDELLKQVREKREQELGRFNLDSAVDSIRERLQDVIDTERQGIDRRVEEAPEESKRVVDRVAKQHRDQLDRLPDDLGGRMQNLRNYEFMDEEAQQKFDELLQELRQQVMDQMFQGMKQAMGNMTQQDVSDVREMVKELNNMLEQRQQGLRPDFQSFMQKFGQFFPPGIENLDQLMEHLSARWPRWSP